MSMELRAKIDEFCKDSESALALFLGLYTPTFAKIHAELYGIDEDKTKKAFDIITPGLLNENLKRELANKVRECVEKFSEKLEKASKERIKGLKNHEREALSYMSYIISYSENFVDRDQSSESLCAILKLKYKEAEKMTLELLAKTGLAFYYYTDFSQGHIYYRYVIPPYAKKIIDELAGQVELKFTPFVGMILNSNDAKLLSAILIALYGGNNSDIFEAVYGEDWHNYIKKINFPYYQGCTNYIMLRILDKVITSKALDYTSTPDIIHDLQINGFTIEREETIKNEHWYYTYLLSNNVYKVTIHIMPFPYKLPEEGEKKVIVLIGPKDISIAKPDIFKNYVVVRLDNKFKVTEIIDMVNEDWSREIVKVFKSLNKSESKNSSLPSLSEKDFDYCAEVKEEFKFPILSPPEPRPKEDLLDKVTRAVENSKQLILMGPPGTGKTHLAMWAAHKLTDEGRSGSWTLVQFHKNYRYDDFIERMILKPRDNSTELMVEPQLFVKLMCYAKQHEDKKVVLVIDEINRADVAGVFGELLYALEYRGYPVRLPYSGQDLTVPPNLYVIATANDIDRGTFDLGVALRRRFAFFKLETSKEALEGLLKSQGAQDEVIKVAGDIFNKINELFEKLVSKKGIGHLFFNGVTDKESLVETWNFKIKPLIEAYFLAPGIMDKKARGTIEYIENQLKNLQGDHHE